MTPQIILSIDMPGGREGGYVIWSNNVFQTGLITFLPDKAEATDFLVLANLLDQISPSIVICERAFLFRIAGYLGALKGFCAERNIPYWQIGPSRAKKTMLGDGRASKSEVLHWAKKIIPNISSFHIADSLLYLEAWRKEHI